MQASDFTPIVAECCSEVLESMYFATVLATSFKTGEQPVPQPGELAFSLRFQGDVHGTFGIALDATLARTLAANFLGEEEHTLTEVEVAEVVGELTNMLCGSVVSRVEGESKFALSHPEPSIGTTLASSTGAEILISELETENGILRTWIAVDRTIAALEHASNEQLQAAN